jgi:hypothetical protein
MLLVRLCLLNALIQVAGFATVDFRSSVREVFVRSNAQQAGTVEVVVNADDFQRATPENPVYMRLSLDKGAVLCNTLVWTSSDNPNPQTQLPIYLPISFENREDGVTIDPTAFDAVSIVRWKAGERIIWLKVTRSLNDLVIGSPVNDQNRVRFGFGFSARDHWARNSERFAQGLASLPGTIRGLQDPYSVTETHSVSTLICLDYTNSNLAGSPFNPETQTINWLGYLALDGATTGVDGPDAVAFQNLITIGNIIQPNFGIEIPIAKGIRTTCASSLNVGNAMIGKASGCEQQGLISFQSNREFTLNCSKNWGFHRGSLTVLTLADPTSDFGFRVQTNGLGHPIRDEEGQVLLFTEDFTFGVAGETPARAFSTPEDIFQATGDHWFTRRAILVYGGSSSNEAVTFNLGSTLYQDAAAQNAVAHAWVEIYSSNRNPEDVTDVAPFDNPMDQALSCPAAFKRVALDEVIELGQFTDCDRAEASTRQVLEKPPLERNSDLISIYGAMALWDNGEFTLLEMIEFINDPGKAFYCPCSTPFIP